MILSLNQRRVIVGGALVALVLGIGALKLNRKETYRTGCETLQGWNHNKADGTVLYTFDEEDKWERGLGEKPNYRVEGNYAKLENGENIGKEYSLKIQGENIGGKLISYQACQ